MNRLLLNPSKYLSSFREGYGPISLFIPFLRPISSIAAGEYPVSVDEDMGLLEDVVATRQYVRMVWRR